MARAGQRPAFAVRVGDGEQAGRRPGRLAFRDDGVEVRQNPVGRNVHAAQLADDRAVVAHVDRGFHAVPHHVGHHQQGATERQPDYLVPVAADQVAAAQGEIARRDLEVRVRRARLDEQRALQFQGDALGGGVLPGALHADRRPVREILREHDVVLREASVPVLSAGSGHGQRADDPAPRDQRNGQDRVDAGQPEGRQILGASGQPLKLVLGREIRDHRPAHAQAARHGRLGAGPRRLAEHVGRPETAAHRRRAGERGSPHAGQLGIRTESACRDLVRHHLDEREIGHRRDGELREFLAGHIDVERGADAFSRRGLSRDAPTGRSSSCNCSGADPEMAAMTPTARPSLSWRR